MNSRPMLRDPTLPLPSWQQATPVFLKKWFLGGAAGHVELTMGYWPSEDSCRAACAVDGIEFEIGKRTSKCGRYVMRDA